MYYVMYRPRYLLAIPLGGSKVYVRVLSAIVCSRVVRKSVRSRDVSVGGMRCFLVFDSEQFTNAK